MVPYGTIWYHMRASDTTRRNQRKKVPGGTWVGGGGRHEIQKKTSWTPKKHVCDRLAADQNRLPFYLVGLGFA